MINEKNKIIFARYNSYIMLPWFSISNILNEFDEDKIKNLVNFYLKFLLQKKKFFFFFDF